MGCQPKSALFDPDNLGMKQQSAKPMLLGDMMSLKELANKRLKLENGREKIISSPGQNLDRAYSKIFPGMHTAVESPDLDTRQKNTLLHELLSAKVAFNQANQGAHQNPRTQM